MINNCWQIEEQLKMIDHWDLSQKSKCQFDIAPTNPNARAMDLFDQTIIGQPDTLIVQ